MNKKAPTLYRRRHLGYLFQMYDPISNLTVRENMEVGAYLSRRALDADALLHMLELWEHRSKLPNQLSGGQQQRTSIGRSIVKSHDILPCDEPTGAPDYKTGKEILTLIEAVNQKYGNTVTTAKPRWKTASPPAHLSQPHAGQHRLSDAGCTACRGNGNCH